MSSEWREFQGVNAAYVVDLYERFQRDPHSVPQDVRTLFETWTPDSETPAAATKPGTQNLGTQKPVTRKNQNPGTESPEPAKNPRTSEPQNQCSADPKTIVAAISLAQSTRLYGHLAAQIDPLGSRPKGDPSLEPATYGVTESDLRALPASLIGGAVAVGASSMWDVVLRLRQIYCSTMGFDVAHIFVPEEREWLREAIETERFRARANPIDPVALLERLTQVEAFERFLQRTFPGKTRFSIEGLDTLVPILDEVIREAAEAGMHETFIAMAHRGRLNVMAHVLGKPYEQILAEFNDPVTHAHEIEAVKWSGDVKYHLGASRAVGGGKAVNLVIAMPPNPSHLEAIDPVLEGMARAAGTDASGPGDAVFNPEAILPILIHGDAAFPGQGVVAETLNLHRLPGYMTGGTIHIISNNQIGFTTEPTDAASTLYSSGLARGFKIPIFHVNADDPEACIAAARLAFAYRARFHRDVLIDLVGYRRYGHNEGDEPAFTQPIMYAKIAAQPTVREIWAGTLEERGVIDAGRAAAMLEARLSQLQRTLDGLDAAANLVESTPEVAAPGTAAQARTVVSLDRLRALNESLLSVPSGFSVHRKLERLREKRRDLVTNADDRTIDWSTAEELAFATILEDGTPIRLTGEDVERGTFSQRHAVLVDAKSGGRFVPLQHLSQAKAAFEIHNSPLSECAAVGFEYGYNIQAPERLVVWEAQYGDFVDGAQVMLDEFVLSARAKWGQEPSLVLLLPHGHEGQGADHASARPERFLQLAADINMRMANCTTAAQYFHLLRRQASLLERDPLPLVVLTPKSLLRHPMVASSPRELSEGGWQKVIDDPRAVIGAGERRAPALRPEDVRRVVFCSGKIAIDLLSSQANATSSAVAVCRVEQLYPLPISEMLGLIERYVSAEEVFWVQEEPENMGAWDFVRPLLEGLVGTKRFGVLARPRSSCPAEGSAARHAQNQERLVAQAFDLKLHASTLESRR